MTCHSVPQKFLQTHVSHHVFESDTWVPKSVKPHPRVNLSFTIDSSDYKRFGFACPTIKGGNLSAIADSGAQCCVWGVKDFLGAGFKPSDLFPVKHGLSSVSKSGLKLSGACFILKMLDNNKSLSKIVFMLYL